MAFTQGAPLPNITETTTTQQALPDYYTNYLSGLSQAGTSALGKTGAELVAGLDPLQKQAYATVPAAAISYVPGLKAAETTAGGVAQGLTPERIQSFMNPYTGAVVDEMARLQQQNIQRNLMPTLKAGFVGQGGLGSQRYANALGQTAADWQNNLLGAQTGALQKGYETALQTGIQEMGQQNQAAQIQGQLAKAEQELGLGGVGALESAGARQQAYQQAQIDAPLKIATAVSNLLSGKNVPLGETKTFTGPKAGSYQTSDLSSILGIMSTLGAIKAGSPGADITGALGKLFSGIGGGSTGSTGGTPEWTWTPEERQAFNNAMIQSYGSIENSMG